MGTALQVSLVQWVTKEKQESQAEWKAAEDLRARRETEVFQVCVPENGTHLFFVSSVGVRDVTKYTMV